MVLDSHALLAYFRGEVGGGKVKTILHEAAAAGQLLDMTEVNYAEVKYTLIKKDGINAWHTAEEILAALPIRFHVIDRRLSDRAADYKSLYKISLADAFAAALAKELQASLVTGDPEFAALESDIAIFWLR